MKLSVGQLTEFILLGFLAIVFLQSALDKLLHWKSNLIWLKGHFSKTFLKNTVPGLLAVILIVELGAGLLSLGGLAEVVFGGPGLMAISGAVTAATALLMLLFGQRVAKDYDGARTLVIYFIPTVFLIFLLEF
ncbi:MAG: hypothetical protein RLZZ241_2523 [Bacteroidota bacterium]|jgi:hypothetical protein